MLQVFWKLYTACRKGNRAKLASESYFFRNSLRNLRIIIFLVRISFNCISHCRWLQFQKDKIPQWPAMEIPRKWKMMTGQKGYANQKILVRTQARSPKLSKNWSKDSELQTYSSLYACISKMHWSAFKSKLMFFTIWSVECFLLTTQQVSKRWEEFRK